MEPCAYEHFVGDKTFRVVEADVVAMGPGIPHGGRNTSDSDHVKLFFVAGSLTHGPWRADFNDRINHETNTLKAASDIGELSGALLDTSIQELKSGGFGSRSIIHPSQHAAETGQGIRLDAFYVGSEGLEVESAGDQIIQIVEGEGSVSVGGIGATVSPGDGFVVPGEMPYRIAPGTEIVLFRFGLDSADL